MVPETRRDAQADVAVLIPAAGAGRRMGSGGSKILADLNGEPVIRHTVRLFQTVSGIGRIIVICRPQERREIQACFADEAQWDALQPLVDGGAERRDSVLRGLQSLAQDPPRRVLVHDGARPCCSPALVYRLLNALGASSAVIPVMPITDTVRRIPRPPPVAGDHAGSGGAADGDAGGTDSPGGHGVVDRDSLVRTQTPQAFRWETLCRAYRAEMTRQHAPTDDAQIVEALGETVATVSGEARNIKITQTEDLELAAWLLRHPDWGTHSAQ